MTLNFVIFSFPWIFKRISNYVVYILIRTIKQKLHIFHSRTIATTANNNFFCVVYKDFFPFLFITGISGECSMYGTLMVLFGIKDNVASIWIAFHSFHWMLHTHRIKFPIDRYFLMNLTSGIWAWVNNISDIYGKESAFCFNEWFIDAELFYAKSTSTFSCFRGLI